MNAEEQSHSGAGSDSNAVLFQGDAFGTAEDYASDMFRQVAMEDNGAQPDNLPPLMEVSDDEDKDEDDEKDDDDDDDSELANMVAELEKSWELPQEGAPCQEAMDLDDDKVDSDDVPGLMDVEEHGLCYEVKRRKESRSGTGQNPQTPTPNLTPTKNNKSHIL